MQELDRARELIDKYLDDVIDQAELAELELTLASEPEAAREFARAARTDGFLYFHFNELRAEDALQFERKPEGAPAPAPRIVRPPVLERLPQLLTG